MSLPSRVFVTPEEYLERERAAETKSEYHDGAIVAMVGGTARHNQVTGNIYRHLGNQLEGGPCRIYINDVKVRIPAANFYTYPDVFVVCGEEQFLDDRRDTLLNSTLIVEVLSPSTEAYDRGRKFAAYRTLPSLRDYVLAAQDEPRLERFTRQESGLWVLSEHTGLDAVIELPSIGCSLALQDVYRGVDLPPALGRPGP